MSDTNRLDEIEQRMDVNARISVDELRNYVRWLIAEARRLRKDLETTREDNYDRALTIQDRRDT